MTPALLLLTTFIGFALLVGVQVYSFVKDSRWLKEPRTQKPAFSPPGQGLPAASAQAQCDYCKRFGSLGVCAGCGAPNKPAKGRPQFILSAPGVVPAFPMVKR